MRGFYVMRSASLFGSLMHILEIHAHPGNFVILCPILPQ